MIAMWFVSAIRGFAIILWDVRRKIDANENLMARLVIGSEPRSCVNDEVDSHWTHFRLRFQVYAP